jgi:membrane AbrB-like protein
MSDIGWVDALWLVGAALLGVPLGRFLRLPAPFMLGPMIVSATIHIAGFVTIPPPDLLVIAAQIVLGVRIGVRFRGVPVSEILRDLRLGAASSVLMIFVALGFAYVNATLSDIDLSQAFLAFSPGGFVEMSLLALAMGQEVAYVSISHVIRIVLVIFGAPMAARLVGIGGHPR